MGGEIAKLLEETRTNERYSLTIIAAIAAWIYAEALKPYTARSLGLPERNLDLIHVLGFLSLVLVVFFGVSLLFLHLNIGCIGNYLRKI